MKFEFPFPSGYFTFIIFKNMNHTIIYLAGFMGAGKSTIGPILANTLGWEFYDLDRVIELKLNKKIKDIFNDDGEKYFRDIETFTLKDLSVGKDAIIALGGGTITIDANMEILKKTGKIIYLKTSPEKVYQRLKNKRDRPILLKENGDNLSRDEFLAKVNALFESRKHFYDQSDIIIDTDNESIGKTIDRLAVLINKWKIKGIKIEEDKS
jgi:shikimate kinase